MRRLIREIPGALVVLAALVVLGIGSFALVYFVRGLYRFGMALLFGA